jgi:hypothetical protein
VTIEQVDVQSTTTLTVPSSLAYGDEEAGPLTVSSSIAGAPASGFVNLTTGSTELCQVYLSNGTASCNLGAQQLLPGSYPISASYNPGGLIAPSTAYGVLHITKAPTTLAVNQAKVGLFSYTFSAQLTRDFDGAPLAGQSVAFRIGSKVECTATTNTSGLASCKKAPMLTFSKTYTASYAGNAAYLGSTGTGKI